MGRFVKGDVVVLPFPFSNLKSSKRRPAVILVDLKGDDFILCPITSQDVEDTDVIALGKDDMENGSLKLDSSIRPNFLFTADKSVILYKLGSVSEVKFDEVIDAVVKMFRGS